MHWPLLLILLSVILQAAVQGTLTTTIRPSESLLFTAVSFALTTAVFVPISWTVRHRSRRRPPAPPAPRTRHLRLIIAMNIATAATFLSYYVSISLIEAATASALETAVGPVALLMLTRLVLGHGALLPRRRRLLAGLLATLGITLAWHTFELTPQGGNTLLILAGLALAATAGVGMGCVSLLSRRFGDLGVSAVTVTAHRFHLTYLLAAGTWLGTTPPLPDRATMLTYAALGIVAVSIPLFLLQLGFQRADPLAAISIVVALPAATYLVQLANGTRPQPATLILLSAIIVTALAQTQPLARSETREPTSPPR